MAGAFAAIDVGTNSFHLVVARVDSEDNLEPIAREREVVRLGSGAGDMKLLAPDAIDRAVETLERFRRVAEVYDAPIRAVATSAVREAANRDDFLRRATEEAGVAVEVISGVEEARLIYLGVLSALPVFERRVLICDIGGGSTELVVGLQGAPELARSVKVGAIRLTERFFVGSGMHPSALDSCRQHVRSTLTPVLRDVAARRYELAVGSSGTIQTVARIAFALSGRADLVTMNASVFTADDLTLVIAKLVDARRAGRLRDVPGLEPKRADIILGGSLVLEAVFDGVGLESMQVSDGALREGVLVDTRQRVEDGTLHHLRDLRRRSVLFLRDRCDEDPGHATQVAYLALQLFDCTAALHELGDLERELLEAGALLANVGLVISHSQHHKHSYYVIRYAELPGFTDREIELIAQIARYHRKSAPKPSHDAFVALEADDQRRVAVLAGILRVAIGLDRNHSARVQGLNCRVVDGELRIDVEVGEDTDISLELYTAAARKGLLERALGRSVVITPAA